MRTRARLRPTSLCAVAALCLLGPCLVGCGGGNGTYNPSLVGGTTLTPTPNFTLAVNPASVTVTQGETASYTITLTAVNGFAALVTPQVTGLPAGVTAAFTPVAVTPTAAGVTTTLTLSTSAASPVGSGTLTIDATGGNLHKRANATLVINAQTLPNPPGSLQGSIE